MMKSLRSNGSRTAPRICFRIPSEPAKNFSSVNTDRQRAPPASYSRAMRSGSKSGQITPAGGDAFLTSAMSAIGLRFGCRKAPAKSRLGPCWRSAAFKSLNVTVRPPRRATSSFFCTTMVSRMFIGKWRRGGARPKRGGGPVPEKVGIVLLAARQFLRHELPVLLFLLPFHARQAFLRTPRAQPRVDERIQVTVHHRLDVAGFHAGAEVFDHPTRLKDIASDLVAPGDT